MSLLRQVDPELLSREEVAAELRDCLVLCHELANLERLLGIDRARPPFVRYNSPLPETRAEAIRQGIQVAEDERHRLGLGIMPVADLGELLARHGIRVSDVDLPGEEAGISLCDPSVGRLVVLNARQTAPRRRFTCARHYSDLILAPEAAASISRSTSRHDLAEIRANAFAAAFLMPERAVHHYLAALGRVLYGQEDVQSPDPRLTHGQGAAAVGSGGGVQLVDVVRLAHYFGVSLTATLYRLENLGLLGPRELEQHKAQSDAGRGLALAKLFGLAEDAVDRRDDPLRRGLLTLAVEALHRDEITRRKFLELARLAQPQNDRLEQLLHEAVPESQDEVGDLLLLRF
jgi:Zn-dependent peptidase ImmA (M78 family)